MNVGLPLLRSAVTSTIFVGILEIRAVISETYDINLPPRALRYVSVAAFNPDFKCRLNILVHCLTVEYELSPYNMSRG